MARIVIPTLLARMADTDNIAQTQTYVACIKARSTLYALRVPQESEHTACPAAYILHMRIKFIHCMYMLVDNEGTDAGG